MLIVFLVLVALSIFWLYFDVFNGHCIGLDCLSKASSDWASFGGLLGGIFTVVIAVATISTFLLLIKEQEHVAKANVETATFQTKMLKQMKTQTVAMQTHNLEMINKQAEIINTLQSHNALQKQTLELKNKMAIREEYQQVKAIFLIGLGEL
ncbi:hypothetical protein [uncultured Shewanella sp.]|uniref:hypothetical protein n=1 Tax=uncultured Shewanella sp. TaxID=173975 RepID=UPI00262CB6EC|nr:hypothetical protein [uncultured Shewanella sp.]